MLIFDKAIYLSFLRKSILSVRFSIFRTHKYSIHFCIIPLLNSLYCYTLLVISSSRYKEYMICLISFSKFSDVLPAFTCGRAIDNL